MTSIGWNGRLSRLLPNLKRASWDRSSGPCHKISQSLKVRSLQLEHRRYRTLDHIVRPRSIWSICSLGSTGGVFNVRSLPRPVVCWRSSALLWRSCGRLKCYRHGRIHFKRKRFTISTNAQPLRSTATLNHLSKQNLIKRLVHNLQSIVVEHSHVESQLAKLSKPVIYAHSLNNTATPAGWSNEWRWPSNERVNKFARTSHPLQTLLWRIIL